MALPDRLPWREVARAHDLELLALFGSQDRRATRPESDVDIAVMPGASAGGPLVVTAALMAALPGREVDVAWLPGASWLLQWEASRGTLLYERRPGWFAAWRNYAALRYADRKVWQDQQTGWLEKGTAAALAPLASLRNHLVHRYEDVEAKDVYGKVAGSIPHWRAYLESLQQRLDASAAG